MDTGEWLTRGTIWLALSLYVTAEMARASRPDVRGFTVARWLNTLGAAAFFGHMASAFHHHHHWSHATALADTARQTAEFTGWNWGGGLYVNYFFALVWVGEVTWLWLNPESYTRRDRWITRCVRGFFLVMIFNGGVVFVRSPMRWFGLIICLALVVCWWRNATRTTDKVYQERST